MEAYCVKCKEKREMKDPRAVFSASGRPMTQGVCPVCGTKMCRLGATPEHEGLVPEKTGKPKAAVEKVVRENRKSAALVHEEEVSFTAYCVKCKEKREMKDAQAVFSASGRPMTRGVCPVCGTKMSRFGETSAHEGMNVPKPAGIERKAAKTVDQKKKTVGRNKKTTSIGGKKATSAAIRSSQSLVIVESPAKARTVGRFLGNHYVVRASVGHVRDLLKSTLSVDVENDFTPRYRVPNEKKDIVKELTALAAGAQKVYLATDPDREGEAIAWHLLEAANIDESKTERVVFHEITEPAIKAAFGNPSKVNMSLVDAQQARRVLDRLVGYQISPLLWNKVRSRLSAGRVQSVALKLIADREREIQNFVSEEFWSLCSELCPDGSKSSYVAKLMKINGESMKLSSEKEVQTHLSQLEKAVYTIKSMKTGERKRHTYPPFTTSTLQQEASKRLGFSTKKTMQLAQQLYEGVDIFGEGSIGLITYMRTDSTNISEIAQNEAKQFIVNQFGPKYIPEKPNVFNKKAKGAQEAHEAVRPTGVNRVPEKIREFLSRDQFRLYQLIWQRFLASQMSDAVYATQTVDVVAENENSYLFHASGSKVVFPGFLSVYADRKDEDAQDEEVSEHTIFPDGMQEGQVQNLKRLLPEQHFTQPPARFTEASIVKTLEEDGIGRPSTYASIISTIIARNYVETQARHLVPTEIGLTVNDLLVEHFPEIDDTKFTSRMEENLDLVAEGKKGWVDVIREFYSTFEPELEKAKVAMPEIPKAEPEKVGRECPECGKSLVYRIGRFGRFISCSGFPGCRYTEQIKETIGVKCPKCGGELVAKRTRTGKTFYGCEHYPNCDFTQWKRPVAEPCPKCGGVMVQSGKNKAECIVCHEISEVESL